MTEEVLTPTDKHQLPNHQNLNDFFKLLMTIDKRTNPDNYQEHND